MKKRLSLSLVFLALGLLIFARYRPAIADPAHLSEAVRGEVETTCGLRAHAESYWDEAFCLEMMTPGAEGAFVHLDHGYRYTTPVDKPAIYMLGNSTMWGSYVLDSETIPSQLQLLVGDAYRVVNHGEPSYTIAAEMADLQTIALRPDDIVVMYDGIADVDGCAIQKDHSEQYRHYLELARAYTLAAGAAWFHFLQPTIYSMPLRADEQEMIDKYERALNCPQGNVVSAEYPQMQRINVGYDFTHILDNARAAGSVIYNDWGHLNKRGNGIVAMAIYDVISTF